MATTEAAPLVQAPDGPRVLGLGVGTFVLLLFVGLALVIGIAGRGTRFPVIFYATGAALVGIVLLILLFAPRQAAFQSPTEQSRLTSSFEIGQVLMALMMLLAVLGAVAGLFNFWCLTSINASLIDD